MKYIASLITFAATSALIVPFAFPHVVAGCSDTSYKFNHSAVGAPNEDAGEAAAKLAKSAFCKAVAAYN